MMAATQLAAFSQNQSNATSVAKTANAAVPSATRNDVRMHFEHDPNMPNNPRVRVGNFAGIDHPPYGAPD